MGATQEPTERDRFWLEHEAVLAKSALTAKAYAAEQGLSMHALYQARKRLRAMGWLPAAAKPRRREASRRAVAFSKVEVGRPAQAAEFRLSLPNGFVLEWSGAELPPAVLSLVERLTASR